MIAFFDPKKFMFINTLFVAKRKKAGAMDTGFDFFH